MTFSVLTVAGIDWVCEQLSETQCKPLYPKVRKTGGAVSLTCDVLFLSQKYQDKEEVGPGQTGRDGEVEYRGKTGETRCHDIIS